jgi:NTE family protein
VTSPGGTFGPDSRSDSRSDFDGHDAHDAAAHDGHGPDGKRRNIETEREPTWSERFRARFGRQGRHAQHGRHAADKRSGGGDGAPQTTAFVLAGGGSRGAVQVGMLEELVRRGIRADRVFGASVGAINGAAYAGDPTPEGIAHMAEVWRGIRGGDIFPKGPLDGPWAYFQKRPSVHANTGLRKIIEAGVRFENLEDAQIPVEVVTTSLTDGRERWITRGPAVDAILASSAIPTMFPPVTIDGDVLVDGGVVNNVPISRALTSGCDRIYVLLCGPLHYHPRAPARPVEALLTAFFVAIHARFVRELASLPHGVEVIVFSGGGEPSGQYRDFSATPALIEEGRTEVADVLDRYVGTSHDLGVTAVGGPPHPTAGPAAADGPGSGSGAAVPNTEPAPSP